MNSKQQLDFICKEIEKQVERYRHEASHYKKVAFRLKILSVFLAAIITVLLGIQKEDSAIAPILSNVALIFGASIAVLSAYEAFFDPRALWIRETVTFARLKDLQRDLEFWKSGLDTDDIKLEELKKFKIRLDLILEDTLNYWIRIKGGSDLKKNLKARIDLRAEEAANR